jgi:hypothetical protein
MKLRADRRVDHGITSVRTERTRSETIIPASGFSHRYSTVPAIRPIMAPAALTDIRDTAEWKCWVTA